MRHLLLGAAALVLGACVSAGAGPKTIAEMHQASEWQYGEGEALAAGMAKDVRRLAKENGRAATLAQLAEAGYDCQYGEAHEDYPEPMAVCTRSFATRACQFDWEVSIESDPAKPDGVTAADAAFTRDCVGTQDDWPVPVNSAIDDQLAPMEPPPASAQ